MNDNEMCRMSVEPEIVRRPPFERSGLARLTDLEAAEYAAVFSDLEARQAVFLEKAREFRVDAYGGDRDPLYRWSRVWEYPYVFWNLQRVRSLWQEPARNPRVADVGSGSTFFPFAVAGLGCDVVCIDVDRAALTEVKRAAELIDCRPGTISTRQTDGATLPLAASDVDVAYCISVLEHVQQYDMIVEEIARALVPGGLCVLTVDIGLSGPSGFSRAGFARLAEILNDLFSFEFADATVHPVDVLTSDNGPYPIDAYRGWRRGWYWAKQAVLKPLLDKRPTPATKLAVYAAVLRKR